MSEDARHVFMGGDGEYAKKIMDNPWVQLTYYAVLILLVFIIVWYMMKPSSERLLGSGVQDQVFTSGATMRRLGQEPTSTNQGEYTIVHNAELKELVPGIVGNSQERLVNERGEPDFWEISSELDAYRSSQVASMAAQAAADAAAAQQAQASGTTSSTEYLARDSVASKAEDQLLKNMLWR